VDIIELMTDARSIVTLVCLATFLGIIWWTYGGGRKSAFAEAARLPFADESDEADAKLSHVPATPMEKRHG
jgi:cytochrome c oxidase cbb3-type subunit 4